VSLASLLAAQVPAWARALLLVATLVSGGALAVLVSTRRRRRAVWDAIRATEAVIAYLEGELRQLEKP
jgi:hypothetical protein